MKRLIVIIWVIFGINACNTDSNARQEIKFYHRDKLGDAGSSSYSDYLAIRNYERKPATARELLQLANSYLDTAHGKFRIEGIIFMAKDIEAPKLTWDSEIGAKERPYFLVTFDYVHSNFETANRTKQLNSITIWKHSKPFTYYQHYFDGKRFDKTNLLDSILNSHLPIINL
jgi:hypothetical protein